MEIRKTGIYKITSPSGKVYIGQSRNITKRRNRYKNNRCAKQEKINASIAKYGWDKMIFEVVHELPNDVSQDVLNAYEIFYIESYKSYGIELLNLREGGHNAAMSKEAKIKLSQAHKGRKQSPEHVEKRRVQLIGKKRPEHIKEDLRLRNCDNKYSLGRKLTDEHKNKIAKANTGVKFSIERRQKISIANKGRKTWLGKKHSQETKLKISLSRQKHSPL